MAIVTKNSGVGSGTSGGSVAEDMYFLSSADRDTFTTNNPSRLKQGITCGVVEGETTPIINGITPHLNGGLPT